MGTVKPNFIAIMPRTHGLTIETSKGMYPAYRGHCRCGWRGPWQDSTKKASGDMGEHMADVCFNAAMADDPDQA